MIPLINQLIYFILIFISIFLIYKVFTNIFHEDWFYQGQFSKALLEKETKFDVLFRFGFSNLLLIDENFSSLPIIISSKDLLLAKKRSLNLNLMVKQEKGNVKAGALIFYFNKDIDCNKPDSDKISFEDYIYIYIRKKIYGQKIYGDDFKNNYKPYKWSSEDLLSSSYHEECLKFEKININNIKTIVPSISIIILPSIESFDTIKFKIQIDPLFLFSWEKIPGTDNKKLIEFLENRFHIDWLKKPTIDENEDGSIMVFEDKNFILMKLNDEKTHVNININDSISDEVVARLESGTINIYDTILNKKIFCSTNDFIIKPEKHCNEFSEFILKIPDNFSDNSYIIFNVNFKNEDYFLGNIELKAITGIGPKPPRKFSINNECNYNLEMKIYGKIIEKFLKTDLLYEVKSIEAKTISCKMVQKFSNDNNVDIVHASVCLYNYFISIQDLCPSFLKKSIFTMIESFKDIIDGEDLDYQSINKQIYDAFIVHDALDNARIYLNEEKQTLIK